MRASSAVDNDLGELAAIYRARPPFTTVYLDASRADESGAHEVALHWRGVRDELRHRGVPDATLDRLQEAVEGDRSPGRHGLVLVAAEDEVLLRATLDTPPARDQASVSPLPDVLPYLAQHASSVPHVVVVADRTGADVKAPTGERVVDGSASFPMHRTATVDWSDWHFQRRVEHTWATNAAEVAAVVREAVAESRAELVVLAGDPTARGLLRRDLASDGFELAEVEAGGRAEGSSPEALRGAVRDAVLAHVWSHRRALLARLQQNLGRDVYGVQGIGAVVHALQRGQVDTLVISDDPSSPLQAWIGPEPTQLALDRSELETMGVAEPQQDRLDAALVRAVVGTGARLLVTPGAHRYVTQGIAATLRFVTDS